MGKALQIQTYHSMLITTLLIQNLSRLRSRAFSSGTHERAQQKNPELNCRKDLTYCTLFDSRLLTKFVEDKVAGDILGSHF